MEKAGLLKVEYLKKCGEDSRRKNQGCRQKRDKR